MDSPVETLIGSKLSIRWIQRVSRNGKLNVANMRGLSLMTGRQCKLMGDLSTRNMSYRRAAPSSKIALPSRLNGVTDPTFFRLKVDSGNWIYRA